MWEVNVGSSPTALTMKKEDLNNIPNYAGIYCIKNTINNKCYIGQSIKLKNRLKDHLRNWMDPVYEHLVIYRAFKKYGIENFEISILKTFRSALTAETKSNLDYWEKYYIKEYDSYNNGYNSTLGGDTGVLGLKHSEETKKKISKNSTQLQDSICEEKAIDSKNWIKVKNVETEEIFIFKSRKEIEKILKLHEKVIQNCLLKRTILANKKYIMAMYEEDFPVVPKFDSIQFDEFKKEQFRCLEDKNLICQYIIENPKCVYGEIKQIYNLSKKTFYNYKKELGLIKDQRCDTIIYKEGFLDFAKNHSKKEIIEHFGIKEKTYYKYCKKYGYKENVT